MILKGDEWNATNQTTQWVIEAQDKLDLRY